MRIGLVCILIGLAASLQASASFTFPSSFSFSGAQVFIDLVESGNTADVAIDFDFDNDGTPDQSVDTDDEGRAVAVLDPSGWSFPRDIKVRGNDGVSPGSWSTITITQSSPSSRSNATAAPDALNYPAHTCTCSNNCGPKVMSPDSFDSSYEATSHGVNVVDGTVITSIGVLGFQSRMLGFNISLHHHSLTEYSGPMGESVSHTYNMHVVQTSSTTAQVVTPALRVFDLNHDSGSDWHYISGFLGNWVRNADRNRWEFTHHTGAVFEFAIGLTDLPGPLVRISEPNGNRTKVVMDYSGFIESVVTDLEQSVSFNYNGSGLLTSITDPLSRTFTLSYDGSSRLTDVSFPASTYVNVSSGTLNTTDALSETTGARTIALYYWDINYANHISELRDARGEAQWELDFDASGRVETKTINGNNVVYTYYDDLYTGMGLPNVMVTPVAQPLADTGNTVTRVTDRMGNITDYEMHGSGGGPVSSKGKYGLRRKVTYTEDGKGNTPLRSGEPDFWEERWVFDCNCLAPFIHMLPYSSAVSPSYDSNGVDTSMPREVWDYNNDTTRRQIVSYELLGAYGEQIKWTKTYQDFDPSTNKYSRELTFTPPQDYDSNALYTSLSFMHEYTYDSYGNRLSHIFPDVTRGVTSTQTATETWTYNAYGQPDVYTDANGNKTKYEYHTSPTSPAYTINEKNTYAGYLKKVTRGYTGSSDTVVNLATQYEVNAIGMVTEMTDPMGKEYTTQYHNIGEVKLQQLPEVTLKSGTATYETRYYYDRAGHRIRVARKNIDFTGSAYTNTDIDTSYSFDDVGNVLKVNVEVDNTNGNDLVTEYAYNANDQQIAVQQPEGNRTFYTYDERRMPLRTFYGIESGTSITHNYPALTATTLTPSFVGYTESTYDSRGNVTSRRDGRGNSSTYFYDFAGRQTASRDALGLGSVTVYDDASQVLTSLAGKVTSGGAIDTGDPYLRSYSRYDERGRRYASIHDANLANDESTVVDPTNSGVNPKYVSHFDKVSRTTKSEDALGHDTDYTYDAANRTLTVTDAYGNKVTNTYDANSNVTQVDELEKAGPGVSGSDETYVTMFEYDELNRRIRTRVRGLLSAGPSYAVDHSSFVFYDSTGTIRLHADAEGKWSKITHDDLGRVSLFQRYDGDPTGSPNELYRTLTEYDDNSRVTKTTAYSDVGNLSTSKQETLYDYDDLNRRVRVVHPDSDDPIDGSGNGTDSTWDRISYEYDANSNMVRMIDQREVTMEYTYDAGNRMTYVTGDLSVDFTSSNREFTFDSLNRMTEAENEQTKIVRTFDDLGRMINEAQSIHLTGSIGSGALHVVNVGYTSYNLDSNLLTMDITGTSGLEDLKVDYSYDNLHRKDEIDARYFDENYSHEVADYDYFGPGRLVKRTYGNGAFLTVGYDGKRRIDEYVTKNAETTPELLVGFEYAYDDVDNPLYTKWQHDGNKYDNYNYDDLYRLTDVIYRDASSKDYTSYGGSWASGNYSNYLYDDVSNRLEATDADPFGNVTATSDVYTPNVANEYTQVERDSTNQNPSHDRAHNMTSIPVRPGSDVEAGNNVSATAVYDTFGQLANIKAGSNPKHFY
ncbi:MAG: RHS repeat protein, partial [Planctomycetes bacterium]|nr:RHS repeat protein [Planctomycetota bacterium]